MAKARHSAEQIINKLPEAEAALSKSHRATKVARRLGISEQTYYHRRQEYGGVRTDQAKRLKELEKQNARLERVVADLTLHNAILKEAATQNF